VRTPCRLIIFLILLLCSCTGIVWAEDITQRLEYPEYWISEGVAQYTLHNFDRALVLIENGLSQDGTLANGWLWRGRVLEKLGRTTEAQESFAKARELDPLIEDPFRKKVGALAELDITPVPTARPVQSEDKLKELIQSDIDVSKKPDPTGPDLVIYDLQAVINPETRQVEITAVIGNEGIKPSRDFFITFYGSYTTPVSSNDTAIGFYLVPNLLPGTKKTIEGYFPISQIPSGNYYIGAYMDPNNAVMEISEDNNGKTAPGLVDVPEVTSSEGSQLGGSQLAVPKRPVEEPISNKKVDLLIESVSGPLQAYLGDSIPVTTMVKNAGDADAGSFRLTLYLSRDGQISGDDIELGFGDVPDLGIGKAREGSATVTIPLNIIPGSYYLIGLADSQNKIRDANRDNNHKSQADQILIKTLELNDTVRSDETLKEAGSLTPVNEAETLPVLTTVTPTPEPSPDISLDQMVDSQSTSSGLPDLVPTDVTSASTGTPGGVIDVSTTVHNKGGGDADSFTVSLFLSPDTVIREDEDLLVGMGEIENLLSGKQRSGNASAPIPETIKPGTYYFGLFVDSGKVINESDELNNYGSSLTPITIG